MCSDVLTVHNSSSIILNASSDNHLLICEILSVVRDLHRLLSKSEEMCRRKKSSRVRSSLCDVEVKTRLLALDLVTASKPRKVDTCMNGLDLRCTRKFSRR